MSIEECEHKTNVNEKVRPELKKDVEEKERPSFEFKTNHVGEHKNKHRKTESGMKLDAHDAETISAEKTEEQTASGKKRGALDAESPSPKKSREDSKAGELLDSMGILSGNGNATNITVNITDVRSFKNQSKQLYSRLHYKDNSGLLGYKEFAS
eukprot:IDg129t1